MKVKEQSMSDLTILKEKNPAVAEFVEAWKKKYARDYDFSKTADQADFYEGVLEMTRHMAVNSVTGRLLVVPTTTGVGKLEVCAAPQI
jgi:hypothetical protein